MKKFLLFFSTLFFIMLPQVSANFDPMQFYLYFNDNSTDNYLYNTVTAIKSENCTYDYCSYGGSSKTVSENLEALIDDLNNNNLTYFITIGYGDKNTDVASLNNVYIYVIDKTKTSTNLNLYTGLTSSSLLDFTLSSSPLDEYGASSGVYGWTFGSGYEETYKASDIVDYIGSHSSSSFDLDVITMYNSDKGPIPRGYSLYFTNLQFGYKIDPFSFKIFTDYVGTSGTDLDLTIDDNVGFFYNRSMMLSWYVNDYNFDGDTSFPGQKPDDEDASNQDIVNGLGDINNNITSTDISGAEGAFDSFFGNFENNDHGLFAIISTPLNFIKSFLNSVCTPLVLPLPFLDQEVTLPCMEYVYTKFFGNFFVAYQTITTGIVAYWVCVNIMRIVKDIKDSEKDTIEVLDL